MPPPPTPPPPPAPALFCLRSNVLEAWVRPHLGLVWTTHTTIGTAVTTVIMMAAGMECQNFTQPSKMRFNMKEGTPVVARRRHDGAASESPHVPSSAGKALCLNHAVVYLPNRNALNDDCQSSSHRLFQKSRNSSVGVMPGPVGVLQSCFRMMTRIKEVLSIEINIKLI